MNKFFKYIIFFCVSFYSLSLLAQSSFKSINDISNFKNKLKEVSKATKSIESDFVQEKNVSVLTKKIVSKGIFCFKKENNIRWEYLEPYKYLVVISNNKISVKDDKSKKQFDSQSSPMSKELVMMMFNFIQGNISACEKEYDILYLENDKYYYLKMIPKSSKIKKMLSQVDLYFEKKDFTVSKVKMLEPGGDYTNIEFINKKLNILISEDKFVIK